MSEVGALIIKLQAETAQFREDMGKAKKDLEDLQDPAKKTGDAMDFTFTKARGSMMLAEEIIGVRLPRHLNSLIAEIPGVGAAFSMMLPIVGILAAIDIIGKLIEKHEEAKRKALEQRDAWEQLSDKVRNGSDDLQVANDRLRDTIAIYSGKPTNNVKLALDEAVVAADKLYGSLANDVQELEKLMSQQDVGVWQRMWGNAGGAAEDMRPYLDAVTKAKTDGEAMIRTARDTGDATKVQTAQLTASSNIQKALNNAIAQGNALWNKSNELQKAHDDPARRNTAGPQGGPVDDQSKRMGTLGNSVKQLNEELDRAKLGGENLGLSLQVGLEDPAQSAKYLSEQMTKLVEKTRELSEATANMTGKFEGEDKEQKQIRDIQTLIAKWRQYSVDFPLAYEIANTHVAELQRELTSTMADEAHKQVQLETGTLPEMLAAQQRGMNALLAGKEKESQEWVKTTQKQFDDDLKVSLDGSKDTEKLAEEDAKNKLALHRQTAQQVSALEIRAVQAQVEADRNSYQSRINLLNKFAADYEAKFSDLQAKIKISEQTGDTQIAAIKKQALQKQLEDIQQAENKMSEAISSNVAKSIVEQKNLVASMRQTGEQMLETMLQNLIKVTLLHDRAKLKDAEKAAADAYAWAGNPILGPIVAAGAFAAVMAFEKGGEIPGTGAVPIIGHGGETVVTRALTDRVEAAEGKGTGKSGDTHFHNTFAPQIHAFDAEGVDRVLAEHGEKFEKHFDSKVRKKNKR